MGCAMARGPVISAPMNSAPACEIASVVEEIHAPAGEYRRSRLTLAVFMRKVRNRILRQLLWRRGVDVSGAPPITTGKLPAISRSADSRILMGSGCTFGSAASISALRGGVLEIGRNVFINTVGGTICASEHITIGDNSMIADAVVIMDDSFHAVCPAKPARRAPVSIGRNVWINPGVRICPGVTIGDHTVVGAGSIVTRDLPAKCFAAGSPARVVYAFECEDDWVRE